MNPDLDRLQRLPGPGRHWAPGKHRAQPGTLRRYRAPALIENTVGLPPPRREPTTYQAANPSTGIRAVLPTTTGEMVIIRTQPAAKRTKPARRKDPLSWRFAFCLTLGAVVVYIAIVAIYSALVPVVRHG